MATKEAADDNVSIPASTPADGETYRATKVTVILSPYNINYTRVFADKRPGSQDLDKL